jgi:hypothetical protein
MTNLEPLRDAPSPATILGMTACSAVAAPKFTTPLLGSNAQEPCAREPPETSSASRRRFAARPVRRPRPEAPRFKQNGVPT